MYNIWTTLNPIINPKAGSKSTSINKLLIDGKVIKDKSNISDAMNNHFCTIGEVLKSESPVWGNRPATVMNSFFIEPICNDDIGLEIRHLNHKKAPGPECIGGKLIQLCSDIFSNNLTKIYNRAIQTGVYPHDKKLVQVIALLKKKGARHGRNNYRPISPLSIFDKIFEKKLSKRLISFLERNKISYCHQYGFRKFYSTLLALIEVTGLIKRFLDEKQYVIGIFIDFRNAFDTVNHDILLDKWECYGIRGHAKFFRSYLTNRRQYTLVNGIKLNFGYVNCGVPQRSVLGPLLFLLYINDIKHAIGCDNVKLFADNTFLSRTIEILML